MYHLTTTLGALPLLGRSRRGNGFMKQGPKAPFQKRHSLAMQDVLGTSQIGDWGRGRLASDRVTVLRLFLVIPSMSRGFRAI
jgi:hypothetical protein